VNIPEDPLAIVIKSARGEHSGNVRAGHSDPMPPAMRYGRVCPDLCNMRQRDFQRALQRPQLIGATHMQHHIAIVNRQVHHNHLTSIREYTPSVALENADTSLDDPGTIGDARTARVRGGGYDVLTLSFCRLFVFVGRV
jgi:hypothetical protein